MKRTVPIALISICFLTYTSSKIMRNNALMSRMVSRFQGNHEVSSAPSSPDVPDVISKMQHVLCKNFPSVACEVIEQDQTLRDLIEQSVDQMKHKKQMLEKATPYTVNSEDLSRFLEVSHTGQFKQKLQGSKSRTKESKPEKFKRVWSHEKQTKKNTEQSYGRKKIRKFYPHKMKYKDKKQFKANKKDYSKEKSMSAEDNPNVQRKHFNTRSDPSDSPVWRIDYMKHGEPGFDVFSLAGDEHSDTLRSMLMKHVPGVDEEVVEQGSRHDVLHPDVYIKKNYFRKSAVNDNLD